MFRSPLVHLIPTYLFEMRILRRVRRGIPQTTALVSYLLEWALGICRFRARWSTLQPGYLMKCDCNRRRRRNSVSSMQNLRSNLPAIVRLSVSPVLALARGTRVLAVAVAIVLT
ncbi:hypothetical protein U1Q18_050435 [Sarracenia purpurea var. burkii]